MKTSARTVARIFFIVTCILYVKGDLPCAARYEKLPSGSFVIYSSSEKGLRFKKTEGFISKEDQIKQIDQNQTYWYNDILQLFTLRTQNEDAVLTFDRSKTFQTVKGFGGAFTDSAALNYNKLSEKTKEKLLMSYFSDNGIEYNLGRVPIGGCDFSTHPYAYNEKPENGTKLNNFNLTMEDYDYKIPLIKDAQKAAISDINLIGTAWSAPAWMKTNKKLTGLGRLLPKYYQTWADYHIKFLEEYDKLGVSFWALTTGNEPLNGIIPITNFNSMGWLPQNQATWIADNLGPSLNNSKFSNLKILALDDQRFNIPVWIEVMALNRRCMQYIDGIALHWYSNSVVHPLLADITQGVYANKFLIATEACVGVRDPNGENVKLGSWSRAEKYIKDIMDDLNHWYVGWMDWNLVLNEQGGPNWYGNFADASILAYFDKDEFVKQPCFYIIGHFSKFIPRGSIRIYIEQSYGNSIENVAFLRPDGGVVVVIYNRLNNTQKIVIGEKGKGHIAITVPGKSIHTILYW